MFPRQTTVVEEADTIISMRQRYILRLLVDVAVEVLSNLCH